MWWWSYRVYPLPDPERGTFRPRGSFKVFRSELVYCDVVKCGGGRTGFIHCPIHREGHFDPEAHSRRFRSSLIGKIVKGFGVELIHESAVIQIVTTKKVQTMNLRGRSSRDWPHDLLSTIGKVQDFLNGH